MPELPEIKAHAERLATSHSGAVLERFEPLAFTVLKTFEPQPAVAFGETLSDVRTRGKFIILDFASAAFVVHLMQGGRLKPDDKGTKKPRGGQARWRFTGRDSLLLTEAGHERKAGVWVVAPDTGPSDPPFDSLGPDIDTVSFETFAKVIRSAGNVRLHGFLRNQHHFAGMGRRLANEVIWLAQLSPFAATAKLSDDEIATLFGSVTAAIADALEDERSRDHIAPSAQRRSQVHNHAGEPCPRCGDTIRAVEYKAYTVNYCAPCQTGGKVLADNTTSKFLK